MKKSIESIWKEGFLKADALIAPKVNDLYNQKSIHIVDEFKEMSRLNVKALIIFSFILLPISFLVRMQYMGVPIFIIFIILVIYSQKHLASIHKIDKTESSYTYLKTFDNWMKARIALFSRLYQYIYPLIFLSVIFGFWFLDIGGAYLGEAVVAKLLEEFPNMQLINGVPVFFIIGVILMMGLIGFLGKRLYLGDLRLLYGGLLDRLDHLIRDMEELRN